MSQPFVHLHCHSHYSLLDGAASIDRLVQRTCDHGMNALAITDHGNLHGALEFYRKARKVGINPIIGYEAYIAPGSRRAKQADDNQEASYHLTLLAQNRMGFDNLLKLASAAFLEGFYRKPRIDKELLQQYHEGLVCLSGCVSGELSRFLLRQPDDDQPGEEALQVATLVPRSVRRSLLHRDSEQRTRDSADGDATIRACRAAAGYSACRYQ